MKINFRSPYTCLFIVLIFYAIKVGLKLFIGAKTGSVAVYGDSLHNLADAFEALLVILAVYISKQPETEKYPLGKSSIESIGSLIIGIVIFVVGCEFLLKSVLGLLAYFNFLPLISSLISRVVEIPVQISIGNNSFIVLFLMALMIVMSWGISWYEIFIGKRGKHKTLVADGKETLVDSWIEVSVLIGLIFSILGLGFIDYIAGIIVSFAIFSTAYNVLKDCLGNLMQKSVESKKVEEIKKIILETKGIEKIELEGKERVMAYKTGKFVFIASKIYVRNSVSSEGIDFIKEGIQDRIQQIMPEEDIKLYLKINVIRDEQKRVIVPICHNKKKIVYSFIEDDFQRARNFYIVDLSGQRVENVKIVKNQFNGPEELAKFIKKKRVNEIYWIKENKKISMLTPSIKKKKIAFLVFGDLFH